MVIWFKISFLLYVTPLFHVAYGPSSQSEEKGIVPRSPHAFSSSSASSLRCCDGLESGSFGTIGFVFSGVVTIGFVAALDSDQTLPNLPSGQIYHHLNVRRRGQFVTP